MARGEAEEEIRKRDAVLDRVVQEEILHLDRLNKFRHQFYIDCAKIELEE